LTKLSAPIEGNTGDTENESRKRHFKKSHAAYVTKA
jgi:hypothetical protein